jgi:hypothetical protein
MTDRIIGHRLFADGVTRTVFLDAAGKQYVLDDGGRVIGVWVHPPEVPSDPAPTDSLAVSCSAFLRRRIETP